MRSFRAEAISAAELRDLNAFVVVLAEAPDGSGMRLEVQKALSFDEQDHAIGQDTYCLSTEDGATCYGGVRSWTIHDGVLRVALHPNAAEALGVEGGFIVGFPRSRLAELRDGLERVLGPSR